MAHKDDQVLFTVQCGGCGQRLTPQGDGVYSHDNDDDCDAGSVTTPVVAPEALAGLFKPKAKKKATAKKTAKK